MKAEKMLRTTQLRSYKDRKEFAKDFKSVYKAPTKDSAWNNLMAVKDKWSEKYPLSFKS